MKRRTLLASASAFAFGLPASASAAASDPGWIDACCRLAGSGAFPDFVAAGARAALEARHGTEPVASLARAAATWTPDASLPPDLDKLAQELLVILYTGETSSSRDGAPFFAWALAWQTLGFAAAPGLCGGGFAAWSQS